jgi:undecaprenyl-diphosphatase
MSNVNFWTLSHFLGFFKRLLTAHWGALVALLMGVCLPLYIFESLAVTVWRNKSSFPWDEPLLEAIHATAQPQLDWFAATLTKLGVFWGVFPAATVIAIGLLSLRRWRSLAYLITVLSGSVVINRSAKMLLHRTRPSLWASIAPESDYAFPSGHAMSSMTFVAALLVLTWGSRWFWFVLAGGSLFVVSIGWTRLYLGVHFPSDVLAGWLVSIAWTVGASLLIRPRFTPANAAIEDKLTVSETASLAEPMGIAASKKDE